MTQSAVSEAQTTFPPGTPIWVDLSSADVSQTTSFYNQLFGWRSEDLGEESGHYNFFYSGDKVVAAVGPKQDPNQPSAWTTYISTNDAKATAKKVTDAGGKVLVPPFEVMDQGSMGIFMDTTGGAFAVWQPAKMGGAQLFNKPVSTTWNEFHTRDLPGAKAFYPKVFGWGIHANEMPGGMGEYVEWQIDGKSIAGATGMSMEPPSVPSYWLVYFRVANTDDIVKRTQELGGTVFAPAMDIPQGRMAVLADSQGAAFAVIQDPA